MWKTLKISTVLFLFMLLTSALSQVFLNPVHPFKQASDSNFSMAGIDKLPEYQKLIANWKITNQVIRASAYDDKDVFHLS
jgi:hypothetical protein